MLLACQLPSKGDGVFRLLGLVQFRSVWCGLPAAQLQGKFGNAQLNLPIDQQKFVQVGDDFRPSRCLSPLKMSRDDQPVVDFAYGYQKEDQEADEVEENCGQERGSDEEGG